MQTQEPFIPEGMDEPILIKDIEELPDDMSDEVNEIIQNLAETDDIRPQESEDGLKTQPDLFASMPISQTETPELKTYIKGETDKILAQFKKIGIVIERGENRRDIVDYSKTVGEFRLLVQESENICEGLQVRFKNNEELCAVLKSLKDTNIAIKNYFDTIMNFFIQAPSKEFLQLTNQNLLIKSVYANIKDFVESYEKLNLKTRFENQEKELNENLNTIQNFNNTIEKRLENIASQYDIFGKNIIENQQKHLQGVDEQLELYHNKLTEQKEAIERSKKFINWGVRGAAIALVLLLLVGVGLGAFIYFENQTLTSMKADIQRLGGVDLIEKQSEFVFEFHSDAKFVDDGDTKMIILKKQKKL